MQTGEWLTRGTVWLALVIYVASHAKQRLSHAENSLRAARWLNTLGCAAFLAHVACAFHFYHHWSHAAAVADTARQTAALTRWNWGGGLWFNYAFALIWLWDVIVSWGGSSLRPQPTCWRSWLVRGFFFLMIVNGAFVFVQNPFRWFGLLLCLVLLLCWWPRRLTAR